MSFIPRSCQSRSSSLSLSYALSPMRRSGSSSMKLSSSVPSMSLTSWGEALAAPMARGKPPPSVAARTLVPLPRLVFPTQGPPFLPRRRRRRPYLPQGQIHLALSSPWREYGEPSETCHSSPSAETNDGKFGTVDICVATRSIVLPSSISKGYRSRANVAPWVVVQVDRDGEALALAEAAQSESIGHRSGPCPA